MKELSLNGIWKMKGAGYECDGTIPGSVYSFLLDKGLMEDPFFRQNELEAQKLLDNEFVFSRSFEFDGAEHTVILRCEGLDTLCSVFVNGVHVADTDNMHRTYEFDITSLLKKGENEISIECHPADNYIKEKQKKDYLYGPWHSSIGEGHIRKAYCMMGWDWGPRLPDAGIWRDIKLLVLDSARITDFHVLQRHGEDGVYLTPVVKTDKDAEVAVTVKTPDGEEYTIPANEETEIRSPKLWWPSGLGEQPLYTVTATVVCGGKAVDKAEKRIGLRTLKLIREKDKYGESFCHEINGVRFFAMGADYIPEDNILSRITAERTNRLLLQCKRSNFNAIRVWGGGYYPDDFFYDACDEMGIIVFQDMMVACVTVSGSDEMKETFEAEIYDNLKRIRHHASLALISGNNEVEEFLAYEKTSARIKNDYLDYFERMIPEAIEKVCPYIPYVPSSPSTCGHFIDPRNENYGDCHYWEVWHGNKPFTEYRNKFFRYLSEFGFQSFPCMKTIEAFTLEEDRNIFSRVMEMHQRCDGGNGKILNYLSATFKYPNDFDTLTYASQLLQAEAMRYGVEHLRRNRGRCMGALYWQLNDIWPTASWASIDYYGRFKALQYVAKRFFAPVMISCEETGEKTTRPILILEPKLHDYATKARLCVTNETLQDVTGNVVWALRDRTGSVLEEGKTEITISALSSKWLDEIDFHKTDVDNNYMSYEFEVNGVAVSEGTVLFTVPKYFNFLDPNLRCELKGDEITVYADAFARYVEIYSPDSDFVLSDNCFDMNAGKKTVKILEGTPKTLKLRSVYDIK